MGKKNAAPLPGVEVLAALVAESGINGNAQSAAVEHLTAVALDARGTAYRMYVDRAKQYVDSYGNSYAAQIMLSGALGRLNADGTQATNGSYLEGSPGYRLPYWSASRADDEYGYGYVDGIGMSSDTWGRLPEFALVTLDPDTDESELPLPDDDEDSDDHY